MYEKSESCPLCGWPVGMDFDLKANKLAKQKCATLQATQSKSNENGQIDSMQLLKGHALAMFYSGLSFSSWMACFSEAIVSSLLSGSFS